MSGAVVALLLAVAIQHGLLGQPDMQVPGNGSSASSLRWFVDRSDSALRTAWVVPAPMLVYRGAMLAWALGRARDRGLAALGLGRWGAFGLRTGRPVDEAAAAARPPRSRSRIVRRRGRRCRAGCSAQRGWRRCQAGRRSAAAPPG